jgi:hypothetical protein
MTQTATLEDVALGDATPAEARIALSEALAERSPATMQKVYTALRVWTWKALNGRRRDDELREWFDILKRTRAYLADEDAALGERLQVLHDLIYESISVSEKLPVDEVLQRRSVKSLLMILAAAPNRQLDRAEIGKRLNLKQSNLTRILNLAALPGLVERTAYGKQAIFQMTQLGAEALQRRLGHPLEQLNDELGLRSREPIVPFIVDAGEAGKTKISPAKAVSGLLAEQAPSARTFAATAIAKSPSTGREPSMETRLERIEADGDHSIDKNLFKIDKPKVGFAEGTVTFSEMRVWAADVMQIQSEANAAYAKTASGFVELFTNLMKEPFRPTRVADRSAFRPEVMVRSEKAQFK